MTAGSSSNSFLAELEAARKRREERNKQKQSAPAVTSNKPAPSPVSPIVLASQEDAPDFEQGTISPEEQALDDAIAQTNIIDAYNLWVPKKHVPKSRKNDGVKCSCPIPGHIDRHPSAWMNQQKGTWFCAACDQGGDLWDFAAWYHGYQVPNYKLNALQFRELREKIATDLGFTRVKTAGVTTFIPPEKEEKPERHLSSVENTTEEPSEKGENLATVTPIERESVVLQDIYSSIQSGDPTLDWRPIVEPGTFLDAWMTETTKDYSPEEYHFWTGLMALGFAVGRNRVLQDRRAVVPNLFVCLTGPSGTGKSQAREHLWEVISLALPWNPKATFPTGTKRITTPGSGEALVKEFCYAEVDPADPTNKTLIPWPIRGFVEYDELARLLAQANRVGSSLRAHLMSLCDAANSMETSAVTSGAWVAVKPFGQVITTTQNRSITALLSIGDDASGFINRWVFVTGKNKIDTFVSENKVEYDNPAKLLKEVYLWANSQVFMQLDQDALEFMENFYDKTIRPTKEAAQEQNDIFNRIDLLVKKLLVLLACNERSNRITLAHAEKVVKIFPYVAATYSVIEAAMSVHADSELHQKIITAVKNYTTAHKKGPTFTNLRQVMSKKYTSDTKKLADSLDLLVRVGALVEEVSSGTRGRSAKRYASVVA